MQNLFSGYRTSVPQLYANLDRTKAKQQDVPVTNVFQSLQVLLGMLLDLKDITGPDRLNRFNLYESAEINGSGGAGVSSGQALNVMETIAHEKHPRGFDFEWTDLAFQEKSAGNTALLIFPPCILFVWLTRSAPCCFLECWG